MLDIAVVILSVTIATYLKFEFSLPRQYYQMMMDMIPLTSVLVVFFGLVLGSYRSNLSYFGFTELFKQLLVTVFVGSILLLLKISNETELPGSIIVMESVTFFLLSTSIRGIPRLQKWIVQKYGINNPSRKRVLIVGAGNAASLVAKQLMNSEKTRDVPCGITR